MQYMAHYVQVTVMRSLDTVSMIIHLFHVPSHDRLSTIVVGHTVMNPAGVHGDFIQVHY